MRWEFVNPSQIHLWGGIQMILKFWYQVDPDIWLNFWNTQISLLSGFRGGLDYQSWNPDLQDQDSPDLCWNTQFSDPI